MYIRMDSRLLAVAGWRGVAQNWSLSRSLLFLSQKSSAVTLNSVQSSISLFRVTLYIVTSFFFFLLLLAIAMTMGISFDTDLL